MDADILDVTAQPITAGESLALVLICCVVLYLTRRFGRRWTHGSNRQALYLDIFNLITVASLIGAISGRRLIQLILDYASNYLNDLGTFGAGALLTLGTAVCAVIYTHEEKLIWLIGFGVCIQLMAISVPEINQFLVWWASTVVLGIWAGVVWVFSFVLDGRFIPQQ